MVKQLNKNDAIERAHFNQTAVENCTSQFSHKEILMFRRKKKVSVSLNITGAVTV